MTSPSPAPIDFREALDALDEHWSPRVVARVNDQYVKVAKVLGERAWHDHADEDELFLVVYGTLRIQLEGDREVTIGPGQSFVVPRGVRHSPVAEEEVGLVLVETVTTAQFGTEAVDYARSIEEQLG